MNPRRALGAAPNVVWRWTNRTPDAPARARVALRCALDQLGYEGEAISDAVLIVSEFVANATEHAVGPYEMRIRRTGSEIVCEVEDHDPRLPKISAASTKAPFSPAGENHEGGQEELCGVLSERGRGLQIVNELARGVWGFRSWKGTKTAWFALPSTSREGFASS